MNAELTQRLFMRPVQFPGSLNCTVNVFLPTLYVAMATSCGFVCLFVFYLTAILQPLKGMLPLLVPFDNWLFICCNHIGLKYTHFKNPHLGFCWVFFPQTSKDSASLLHIFPSFVPLFKPIQIRISRNISTFLPYLVSLHRNF